MKRKVLKGFTLLELIIVMTVFSILMLGAMSLVGPVSRIHKHGNDFEKTYSYVDNIQNYLQNSLEYSDALHLYQGSKTQTDLEQLAYSFKEIYYRDILAPKSETQIEYANVTIRVMTLLNQDTTIGNVTYPKGQILMQDVTYKSNERAALALSTPQEQINPQFFADKYAFDYVLGNGTLTKYQDIDVQQKNVTITKEFRYLDILSEANKDAAINALNYKGLEIGIVAYDTTLNKSGDPEYYRDFTEAGSTRHERAYVSSSQYIIANIPLMNIIARSNSINKNYFVYALEDDNVTTIPTKIIAYPGTWHMPVDVPADFVYHPSRGHNAFETSASDISMDINDNIYIVYALPNEVGVTD